MATHPDVPVLTWTSLAAGHVPAWHRLLEVSTAADDGDEHLTVDDLHDELAPSYLDLGADSVIGLDHEGIARAFGLVTVRPGDVTERRVFLSGTVDPAWRGRGIGRELLRRQLDRASGIQRACLDVDSENGSGPVAHNCGLGYRVARMSVSWRYGLDAA